MFTQSIKNHNTTTVISLNGELNIVGMHSAEPQWYLELDKQVKTIAFDCSDLKLIDSTAIGGFVKFFKECNSKGVELIIFGLKQTLSDLFSTTRLDKFFKIISEKEFADTYL